jgi:SAM-dependent methyltransferase
MDGRLSETFDVVFTTYGVITWLSDLDRWAKVVARHLKGGGRLFLAEIHPASMIFDNEAPHWKVRYDYFHSADPAIVSNPTPDYADPAYVSKSETHEWQWTLSDVFRSLQGAGLEIIEFNEYPYSCYRQFPTMTKRDDGFWHLPEGSPRIPLLFSVKAQHRHP